MAKAATAQEGDCRIRALMVGAFFSVAGQNALADGTAFFSTEQVSQGRWVYSQKCAVCHGAQLQGGGAP